MAFWKLVELLREYEKMFRKETGAEVFVARAGFTRKLSRPIEITCDAVVKKVDAIVFGFFENDALGVWDDLLIGPFVEYKSGMMELLPDYFVLFLIFKDAEVGFGFPLTTESIKLLAGSRWGIVFYPLPFRIGKNETEKYEEKIMSLSNHATQLLLRDLIIKPILVADSDKIRNHTIISWEDGKMSVGLHKFARDFDNIYI